MASPHPSSATLSSPTSQKASTSVFDTLPTSALSPRDLNLRLSDLEDQGILAFRDAILHDDNFELISHLVSVLQWNSLEDEGLVDLIGKMFKQYGKEDKLMVWAIRREIQSTPNPADLFRMQSFATQLLFKFFFNTQGQTYLKNTVTRVLETVSDMKEDQLDLVPNGVTVSVEEANENLAFVLDIAGDLLKLLQTEVGECPREIRKGFEVMKVAALERFPDEADTVVPVVFFLRFLCPTLVQPVQFGLASEDPAPHVFKTLLIASKLLQNIANGVVKNNVTSYGPHDEIILKFVKKHVTIVKEFANILSTPPPLSPHEVKTPSSSRKRSMASKQETSLDQLHQFVMQGQYRFMLDRLEASQKSIESEKEKALSETTKFAATMKKHTIAHDWRKMREKHSLSIHGLKKTLFWFLVKGKVKTPLSKVKHVLENMKFSEWIQDVFGDKILNTEKCSLLDKQQNMKELWNLKFKFPFPYGSCSTTNQRVFFSPSPTRFFVFLMPSTTSSRDGAGGGDLTASGRKDKESKATLDCAFMFEERDKNSCSMHVFFALAPGGTYPTGFSISMSKPLLGGIRALKELILSNGHTNTRRTRRSQRPIPPGSDPVLSSTSFAFSNTESGDSPKRGRRRANSDSMASSEDPGSPSLPRSSSQSLNRSMSLKRLKRISKRLSIIPKDKEKEKEVKEPGAFSHRDMILGKKKPSPRVEVKEKSFDSSLVDSASLSDDYDLVSYSDEESRTFSYSKNARIRRYRDAVRSDMASHRSRHNETLLDDDSLDASYDLLERSED